MTNARADHPRPKSEPSRPTPVAALALKHTQLSEALAAREDRFSQLMSRLVQDEFSAGGQAIVSTRGLSAEELAELDGLREGAHIAFRQELADAISQLRVLLGQGDPLYTLAMIQMTNVIGGWGTYYEPTHRGLESKVELVAGLLLTQQPPADTEPVSDNVMQAIHDELLTSSTCRCSAT